MVIPPNNAKRGALLAELAIAMAILVAVVLPVASLWLNDVRGLRAVYWRAIAAEIVDGEFEVLAAGEWHRYGQGTHSYVVTANAGTNLPPGRFTFTVQEHRLRLEWKADKPRGIGTVAREMEVR